jgi:hypothetical protein
MAVQLERSFNNEFYTKFSDKASQIAKQTVTKDETTNVPLTTTALPTVVAQTETA